jgi:hypothetical protein
LQLQAELERFHFESIIVIINGLSDPQSLIGYDAESKGVERLIRGVDG